MKGLIADWQSLPLCSFSSSTTSADNGSKCEELCGVRLVDALDFSVKTALRVESADGMAILLKPEDVSTALLSFRGGILTLVFPADPHRGRWLKNPVLFQNY